MQVYHSASTMQTSSCPGALSWIVAPESPTAWCAAAGEHTVIMLRPLQTPEVTQRDWMEQFSADFRCRFMALLPGAFRDFPPPLVLSLLAPKLSWSEAEMQVRCLVSNTQARIWLTVAQVPLQSLHDHLGGSVFGLSAAHIEISQSAVKAWGMELGAQ